MNEETLSSCFATCPMEFRWGRSEKLQGGWRKREVWGRIEARRVCRDSLFGEVIEWGRRRRRGVVVGMFVGSEVEIEFRGFEIRSRDWGMCLSDVEYSLGWWVGGR